MLLASLVVVLLISTLVFISARTGHPKFLVRFSSWWIKVFGLIIPIILAVNTINNGKRAIEETRFIKSHTNTVTLMHTSTVFRKNVITQHFLIANGLSHFIEITDCHMDVSVNGNIERVTVTDAFEGVKIGSLKKAFEVSYPLFGLKPRLEISWRPIPCKNESDMQLSEFGGSIIWEENNPEEIVWVKSELIQ